MNPDRTDPAFQLLASGFLPARGSLMLDFVFLATFGILLVMAWSIFRVRRHRQYRLHARTQITLAIVLLVAITAFEIDLRFFTDWRKLAEPSPFYASGWVDRVLWIHLMFSIPTPLLWIATVVMGLRWFGWDAVPNQHSRKHRVLGWASAIGMTMTTTTGWVFYYVAFIAI